MNAISVLKPYLNAVQGTGRPVVEGFISKVIGLVLEATLPNVAIGEMCEIHCSRTGHTLFAEVTGLRENRALLMPLGSSEGLMVGDRVRRGQHSATVSVSSKLLGRVIDAMGRPLDGKPLPMLHDSVPLYRDPPAPLERRAVNSPFATGIRAIDGLLTLAVGMRMGIFAGAGVGKSTLLGMALKNSVADVNVVALVGERGREVTDFVHSVLGPERLARSIVVVATSERSPLERVRAAFVALAISEYFRAEDKNVLLVMDSLTRLAMAQREIGLAIGEPPTTKGYTPSVFSLLPRLLERVCPLAGKGAITGLFTILVEGDDLSDPVADSVRSLIDGHIVLNRDLASRGHYPAIDILTSLSRVMTATVTGTQQQAANQIRETLAIAKEAQELINFGAYVSGKNVRLDRALEKNAVIERFLKQSTAEPAPFGQTLATLNALAGLPS